MQLAFTSDFMIQIMAHVQQAPGFVCHKFFLTVVPKYVQMLLILKDHLAH